MILEPVETDVDSLKALLTVDKGTISRSRGECTAKPLTVLLGKEQSVESFVSTRMREDANFDNTPCSQYCTRARSHR